MNLSPEALASFKKQAKAFYIMYQALVDNWNKKEDETLPDTYPIATTLAVLVQNIQFSGVECKGYNHKKAVADVDGLIKLLKIIYDYDQSYMSLLPYNELKLLWEGAYFSDDKW